VIFLSPSASILYCFPFKGIVNYQGTPAVTVGVLDSAICAAILVSIAVTSSDPIAALAQAIASVFLMSLQP